LKSNYYYHCENLKTISEAIKSIQRTLRIYISKNEEKNIYIYTKILSFLINSWAEVRLLKLIYEKDAFSESEINEILILNADERWQHVLNIAFCKAYRIPNIDKIDNSQISYTSRSRREALLKLIKEDLIDSIQARNRIAHGQWKYAFNNDLKTLNGELIKNLKKENIIKLQLKLKMFQSLAQIIHDLAVSTPTFERDFDVNYKKIEEQKQNFHKRDYDDYKEKMIKKRTNGLKKREINKESI